MAFVTHEHWADPASPETSQAGAASESPERADLVDALAPLGVSFGYWNTEGRWVDTPTETLRAAFADFCRRPWPHAGAGPLVCTPGRYHPQLFGTLILQSGSHVRASGTVNEPGYHILYTDAGVRRFVIAAPERFRTPARGWGWQVQLYAARSQASWGIGDFRDLALICRLAREQGASCVQVSPVHAAAPVTHPQDSPYSPASRLFLNLLHIAPGAALGAELVDLSDLAERGRALNRRRLIDRTAVWAIKQAALERIWAVVRTDPGLQFDRYVEQRGRALQTFATWCAIVERQPSSDWRRWPEGLRRPSSAAARAFAETHADRVRFYAWCQWVADFQYAQACRQGVDVVADVAVGFDATSADAWALQDLLSFAFEIGAPPDKHNTEGQRWGLPPFDPQALTQADFAPFIDMVRSSLRHAGALRIDHVMQLWRLYWIPVDADAADGVYVYYPVDALLAILRLEAARANAWIVGEDMGTVASGVRETMDAIGMLGNRSAMRTLVNDFPVLGVGTSSTHDQVTVAGLLTGSDVADLHRIGKNADWEQTEYTRRALAELAHLDPDRPGDQLTEKDIHAAVIERYRLLSSAPSLVVVASLDDAAMVRQRPNMPGTVGGYPNWRIGLPAPVEDVLTSPMAQDLVHMFNQTR